MKSIDMKRSGGSERLDSIGAPRPSFRKTVLPNGVRVLTEQHPSARAVSVGFWVGCGTRDESLEFAGVSHFLEHMVFKRTKKRTAFQIARVMEAVGGEINAYTTKEYTCFHTHCLKDYLELSVDVLSDLVCRASFDRMDFERERQVVLQEIHMSDDQLEDSIYDHYFTRYFGKNPLARPILGTESSIESLRRQDVVQYYRQMYAPRNLIVSVAGNVEHDKVVGLIRRHLKIQDRGAVRPARRKPKLKPFRSLIEKPSEQVHILMGIPAASFKDPLRFEGYVVNTLLGGGMTSKLYQSIRESRGLVYSIYSQLSTFTDSGMVTVYAGTETKNARKVVALTMKELERLRERGVSRSDVELYKTQVKGQILLGADDVENRMTSLGINELVFGQYRPVEEVIAEVDAVNVDSVNEYIETHVDSSRLGLLLMGATGPDAARWMADI